MKIENAKVFGLVRQGSDDYNVQVRLLRDESWQNRVDIQRVKNAMGMNKRIINKNKILIIVKSTPHYFLELIRVGTSVVYILII